jgi:hypothetical protein
MDGSARRVKKHRRRASLHLKVPEMIPSDIESLRMVNARRPRGEAAQFAALEFGHSDRTFSVAAPSRRRRLLARFPRAAALLAYFSPRYFFHGSQ